MDSDLTQQPLIRLENVTRAYKMGERSLFALREVSLGIKAGEFIAVTGPSGSGKSTMLNLIGGIDKPDSGRVWVDGLQVDSLSENQLARWRGEKIGIVFQFFQLLPTLTALENVMLPMELRNTFAHHRRARAAQSLAQVGLAERGSQLPSELSGGEQQRVAIARALANDPPVICADEPTGNLDTRSADVVIKLFEALVKKGKTIAMVTHDPSLTERTSRTIIISDGELIDETVAKCLALLDPPQMLEATRQLEHFTYQPDSTILPAGQHVDYFFMIKSGVVEVQLESGPRNEKGVTIARMGPGQFFGEIELVRGGQSIACIRTTPQGPVELVALQRAAFQKLVSASPLTEEAIGRIVQSRLAENRAAGQKQKRGET